MIDSKNREPVSSALLILQFDSAYSNEAYTGSAGCFYVNIPDKYLGKKLSLDVSLYGYVERTFNFNFTGSNSEITIKLLKSKENITKLMGKMEYHQ